MATQNTKPKVGMAVHYVPTAGESGAIGSRGCRAGTVYIVHKNVVDADSNVTEDNETNEAVGVQWINVDGRGPINSHNVDRSEGKQRGTWHDAAKCDN